MQNVLVANMEKNHRPLWESNIAMDNPTFDFPKLKPPPFIEDFSNFCYVFSHDFPIPWGFLSLSAQWPCWRIFSWSCSTLAGTFSPWSIWAKLKVSSGEIGMATPNHCKKKPQVVPKAIDRIMKQSDITSSEMLFVDFLTILQGGVLWGPEYPSFTSLLYSHVQWAFSGQPQGTHLISGAANFDPYNFSWIIDTILVV